MQLEQMIARRRHRDRCKFAHTSRPLAFTNKRTDDDRLPLNQTPGHSGNTPENTWVPVRTVVEGMRLDWSRQHHRLNRNKVLARTMVTMTIVAEEGKLRELVGPHFWLATISTKQIPNSENRKPAMPSDGDPAPPPHLAGPIARKTTSTWRSRPVSVHTTPHPYPSHPPKNLLGYKCSS